MSIMYAILLLSSHQLSSFLWYVKCITQELGLWMYGIL